MPSVSIAPESGPGGWPATAVVRQTLLALEVNHGRTRAWPEVATDTNRIPEICKALLHGLHVCTFAALAQRRAWIGRGLASNGSGNRNRGGSSNTGWGGHCRGRSLNCVVLVQDPLRPVVVHSAIFQTVVSAVDTLGDLLEILLIRQWVQTV